MPINLDDVFQWSISEKGVANSHKIEKKGRDGFNDLNFVEAKDLLECMENILEMTLKSNTKIQTQKQTIKLHDDFDILQNQLEQLKERNNRYQWLRKNDEWINFNDFDSYIIHRNLNLLTENNKF